MFHTRICVNELPKLCDLCRNAILHDQAPRGHKRGRLVVQQSAQIPEGSVTPLCTVREVCCTPNELEGVHATPCTAPGNLNAEKAQKTDRLRHPKKLSTASVETMTPSSFTAGSPCTWQADFRKKKRRVATFRVRPLEICPHHGNRENILEDDMLEGRPTSSCSGPPPQSSAQSLFEF